MTYQEFKELIDKVKKDIVWYVYNNVGLATIRVPIERLKCLPPGYKGYKINDWDVSSQAKIKVEKTLYNPELELRLYESFSISTDYAEFLAACVLLGQIQEVQETCDEIIKGEIW